MAAENVLALRRLYDEWAKGNLAAGGDLFAANVLFEPFPERAAMHGLEAVGAYMREFLAQWDGFRVEAREFIEAGDSVVVEEHQSGKGEASGIEMTATFYAVWTFRDGAVTHVRWENDRATALEAARLQG